MKQSIKTLSMERFRDFFAFFIGVSYFGPSPLKNFLGALSLAALLTMLFRGFSHSFIWAYCMRDPKTPEKSSGTPVTARRLQRVLRKAKRITMLEWLLNYVMGRDRWKLLSGENKGKKLSERLFLHFSFWVLFPCFGAVLYILNDRPWLPVKWFPVPCILGALMGFFAFLLVNCKSTIRLLFQSLRPKRQGSLKL